MPVKYGPSLDLSAGRALTNLSSAELVEYALRAGEGRLASNGALVCSTGARTGRSPKDKFLEDTAGIHDKIWWGNVNVAISPEKFDRAVEIATRYLNSLDRVFVFDGFAGAEAKHRLGVRVVSGYAWHSLFAQTLFIEPGSPADAGDGSWKQDWTILAAGAHELTRDEQQELGHASPVLIAQSLERKTVVILGTQYAGEIKKSIFYAMNFDMPEAGVFPMHCSCNVDAKDPSNVALFFGLSGTGKTTLSADPNRALVGDDEHGWGPSGIFNFEGGCYAKCIRLSEEGEPQIWNAIRFGSVLENVMIDAKTRRPDYDDGSMTENSRVTYPVDFIPGAKIPSVAGHAKNVIFLTADAFGVVPPVSRLSPEQAMYYFINGYTSKLAGTEAGVTEPVPNFSPCFGGPFLPRPPGEYAAMLAERIRKHNANVWLLNTGWTGGGYGKGHRFELKYTRQMVSQILSGELARGSFEADPVFGLSIPTRVAGVPDSVLRPRNTWADGTAYDAKARHLAQLFRENASKYDLSAEIIAAGPRG
ncbi:MAG: phosphoenolpyruvate carboxykinase (ATP) [Phycisphaeraceae bacterium]|nr:phosphoenolpyruvate carboxykinase (ATP) [Phycisphaeraceae bacterium]MCW5762062.1 phosphoenolpyruvate carboxykinase (ATP) [Phycisphaeraceae bacterium]